MKRDLSAEVFARVCAQLKRGFEGWLGSATPNRQRPCEGKMRSYAHTEPLYDVDWINGQAIEVFFVDGDWAREFGGRLGWYYWACYPG
jgi:hypothetical protein